MKERNVDTINDPAEYKAEARESFILCIVCSVISFVMIVLCFIFRDSINKHPGVLAIIYGALMILLVMLDCRKLKTFFKNKYGVYFKSASLYALLFGVNLFFEVFLALRSVTALFVVALIFNAVHLILSVILRLRLLKEN